MVITIAAKNINKNRRKDSMTAFISHQRSLTITHVGQLGQPFLSMAQK
jgi:hypothetical protein